MFESMISTGYASRVFILLLVLIFLGTFASAMVRSPIPFLLGELTETPEARQVAYGILVSVGSVAMIVANLVGGFLGDMIERRRVISVSLAILTSSLFIYTIIPNVYLVMATYFVQAFASTLSQPAFMALVADLSKTRSRGTAYGVYNLCWFGSQVPSLILGGLLANMMGVRFPFGIAAIVSVSALVISLGLAKTVPRITSEEKAQSREEIKEMVMPFATVMLIFGIFNLLNGLLNGMLSPLFVNYPIDKLKADPYELGLAYALGLGATTALVQIPGGKLADKIGRKPLLLFSFIGIPFVVAIPYTTTLFGYILVQAALVAFGNIGYPAYSAWLMDLVPSTKRGRVSGIMGTISGIFMVIGPLLSTWLYVSQPSIVLPFLASALPWILLIPLVLVLKETKQA